MHDAFISYAKEDCPLADSVCTTLEAAGLACWIAPRDIRPGSKWPEAIVAALGNSRLIVVVFSASANASSQVMREVELADVRGLTILPFRVEDCEPTGTMEYFLRVQHWLDATSQPMEERLADLVDAVRQAAAGAEDIDHPVDVERSAEHESVLLDAADAQDAAAATTLGLRARERGDHDEAWRWFSKGAEGEDVIAATNLGLMAKERGDPDLAWTWFTRGAEGGDVMAATNLGLLAKERGDQDGAREWLTRGAKGGDQLAKEELGRLD